MAKPIPIPQLLLFTLPAVLTTVILALTPLGWDLHTQLENSRAEVFELREVLHTQVTCTPVQVTCVCPEYDQGWDDAEFAEGCDYDFDLICAELHEFGYVPNC